MVYPNNIDDELVKQTAKETGLPLKEVMQVFQFHWSSCLEAVRVSKRVEVSGIGMLKFSLLKFNKQMDKLKSKEAFLEDVLQKETEPHKIARYEKRLVKLRKYMNDLNDTL